MNQCCTASYLSCTTIKYDPRKNLVYFVADQFNALLTLVVNPNAWPGQEVKKKCRLSHLTMLSDCVLDKLLGKTIT